MSHPTSDGSASGPDELSCPQCHSAEIVALGPVRGDPSGVWSAYRCYGCGLKEFWLCSTDRRIGASDRRAP